MSSTDENIKSTVESQVQNQNLGNGPNRMGLLTKLMKFQESLRDMKTITFLAATAQLCHMDTSLAQHLWIQLFPRLWKILSDKQQTVSIKIMLKTKKILKFIFV